MIVLNAFLAAFTAGFCLNRAAASGGWWYALAAAAFAIACVYGRDYVREGCGDGPPPRAE